MPYIIRDTKSDLWQAFRTRVAQEGRSLRWVLEELIRRYVDGRTRIDAGAQETHPEHCLCDNCICAGCGERKHAGKCIRTGVSR